MASDIQALDPEDPFEVDEKNRPHLYKHLPKAAGRFVAVGLKDILDIYQLGDTIFVPAPILPAEWIMVGEVPALILAVPLAPPKSGDPKKCRPIGLYPAPQRYRDEFLEGR